MSLAEPIVEGAYYLREDGQVLGPAAQELCNGLHLWRVGPCLFTGKGGSVGASRGMRLTRRVWITHADPSEVVASLRDMATMVAKVNAMSESQNRVARLAIEECADLVAENLVGGG